MEKEDGTVTVIHWSFHWWDLLPFVFFFIPVLIGFVWIRPDANTRGQPGLLWAVLTIPLSWVAILAYVVVRALAPPTPVR
jgi:cytochrome bd-type quinol oxidase subunit 1